jgi:hypothetical protein
LSALFDQSAGEGSIIRHDGTAIPSELSAEGPYFREWAFLLKIDGETLYFLPQKSGEELSHESGT